LDDVSVALMVIMRARRWGDVRGAIDAYARHVRAKSGTVFQAAVVWKLLEHACTLRDAQPFWECLTAAREEIQSARSAAPLDAAIAAYRRALERRDVFDAFEHLTTDERSVN
jgi:hypothetical protein